MCVPSFSQQRRTNKSSSVVGTLNNSRTKQLLLALPPLKFDAASFYYPSLPEQQQQQQPYKNTTTTTQQTLLVDNKQNNNNTHHQQQHQHQHIIVQHDYHDRASEKATAAGGTTTVLLEDIPITRGGVAVPFPPKLHEMLQQVQVEGLEDIVSWQPHGRCFLVHDPKGFVDVVLPKYFKQSKLASFQRQLNLYGFQRLTKGNDKGGYYHEYFLRGRTDLCSRIHRLKVKGTGVRARSNPDAEPNLWQMSWIDVDGNVVINKKEEDGSNIQEENEGTTTMMTNEEQTVTLPQAQDDDDDARFMIPSRVSSDSSMTNNKGTSKQDLDDLFFFEGRAFHALEASQLDLQGAASAASAAPTATISTSNSNSALDDVVLDFDDSEIDTFLTDIKLPGNFHLDIIDSIDDDVAFGNLLERLIDEQ